MSSATPETTILIETHDFRLVALSVILALWAAYAALDLAGRVTAARRWARVCWLLGGATAMGLGIWAMHYVGMLAFTLPVPIFYHYPTVILSLLAAIGASLVALYTTSRERMGVVEAIIGSLFMGGGIASMHYIGMAAMRLPAMMEYSAGLVLLSIALAVVISLVALLLTFQVRLEKRTSRRKVVSALIMGSAIPLMHYTGMWAVTFHPSPHALDLRHAISISSLGITAISVASFFVLAGAIASSFLDRLLDAQRAAVAGAREGEIYFRALTKGVPEMVWTALPDGEVDFFNDRWSEYTGLTLEQSCGHDWLSRLHPDDLQACQDKWDHCVRTGETYQIEYRFRRASDGTYRWFLGRANPIRDDHGKVFKWFGTCTDIEDQKQNQQVLEEQIRERTVALDDANTRLQEEMWERDAARKELDHQNELMMQGLTERSQRATLLARLGEHLQSCISKEEVLAAALGFGPKIFPATRGAVALLNQARTLAEVIGDWANCRLSAQVFEPSGCWALRTGHPHLVVAGDLTAPCAHAAGVLNTYLCIPILAQGEALGVMHFQTTDEAPQLEESELSFKTTFAGQVGLSLANIRLREALRTQSIKDPLTGLYNRRYLEETLDREVRRSARSGQALGVLMLDVDHFKKFNDTYGHDAGDAVLRETALFVINTVRVEDTVCRFGGEEFVVILPTADVEAARTLAERIRSRMKELTILHQGQSLGKVTVSIGVSAFPRNGASPKELLEAADAALYCAKREGRDRVATAEAPPATDEIATALLGMEK